MARKKLKAHHFEFNELTSIPECLVSGKIDLARSYKKKSIKDITDGDVIELAKLIKTNSWDNKTEITYWEKFQNEPFYEMFSHCKSYAINSIYFNKDVWEFLTHQGYDIGEFKERPNK